VPTSNFSSTKKEFLFLMKIASAGSCLREELQKKQWRVFLGYGRKRKKGRLDDDTQTTTN
jgi:hypothetical protein